MHVWVRDLNWHHAALYSYTLPTRSLSHRGSLETVSK